MQRCPLCGAGRLVWDHRSGYVVCSRCGAVVDIIFHEGPVYGEEPHHWIPQHAWAPEPAGGRRRLNPVLASPEPAGGSVEVAVSVYTAALRAGLPARSALKLARKASGLSTRSVRSVLAKYRA